MKTKATSVTNRNYGKFADLVRTVKVLAMPVYHEDTRPSSLMSMNEISAAYPLLARTTLEVYAGQGKFPNPVALMVGGQHAPRWLYERSAVEDYFQSKSTFDQQKYEEMVAKSRALQARGARLRYKADKMKEKFQLTIKENK